MNMTSGREEMAAFGDVGSVLNMTEWGDFACTPASDMSDDLCISNLFLIPHWFDLGF
jgi:hypothetical protein